jgi:hypothetical protein
VPPDVPASLRPAAGEILFLEARATGVQIYECTEQTEPPAGFAWVLRSPEATLADRSGRSLGKHYGGPTWEASDRSKVVGEVKAREPGPDKLAIPWLLLTAKSSSGSGLFSGTKSIQRVQTHAGLTPTQLCTPALAKQMQRVPYTATYYFYR